MDTAFSINGVPIRLTDERWRHITSSHDDLAGYDDACLNVIENPDWVLRGRGGSLKAVKSYGRRGYLVVAYREMSRDDGFVITAYFARRINRKEIVWPRQPRRPR